MVHALMVFLEKLSTNAKYVNFPIQNFAGNSLRTGQGDAMAAKNLKMNVHFIILYSAKKVSSSGNVWTVNAHVII